MARFDLVFASFEVIVTFALTLTTLFVTLRVLRRWLRARGGGIELHSNPSSALFSGVTAVSVVLVVNGSVLPAVDALQLMTASGRSVSLEGVGVAVTGRFQYLTEVPFAGGPTPPKDAWAPFPSMYDHWRGRGVLRSPRSGKLASGPTDFELDVRAHSVKVKQSVRWYALKQDGDRWSGSLNLLPGIDALLVIQDAPNGLHFPALRFDVAD